MKTKTVNLKNQSPETKLKISSEYERVQSLSLSQARLRIFLTHLFKIKTVVNNIEELLQSNPCLDDSNSKMILTDLCAESAPRPCFHQDYSKIRPIAIVSWCKAAHYQLQSDLDILNLFVKCKRTLQNHPTTGLAPIFTEPSLNSPREANLRALRLWYQRCLGKRVKNSCPKQVLNNDAFYSRWRRFASCIKKKSSSNLWTQCRIW